MKNHRGFTLIELMITMAIAAILISIATPSFRNMIVNNRLGTISSELADVISFARSESIKRNRTIFFCRAADASSKVCADGATWAHWIVKQNAGSSDEDDVLRRGSISSYNGSIQVTTSNISNSRISFSTDGLARSGSSLLNETKITVCTSSEIAEPIRHINLGAASQISITKDSGDCL